MGASSVPATHDIFVVGTSAGGVQALKALASGLPADFPGSVFVVIHTSPDAPGLLPAILERSGPLPARHPADGEPIQPGRIYVAPPDHHMTLGPGHIHLSRGPRENNTRPSINPLFRSAARTYGRRVVGIILTGTLDDGTAGLLTVEVRHGITIVQDPDDADFRDMPENAIDFVTVDYVLALEEISACMVSLSRRPLTRGEPMEDRKPGQEVVLPENAALGLSCPECHGSLWEVPEGELPEYRCRIGHLYSPESLMHKLSTRTLEELDSAYRALREEAAMAEKLLERAVGRNAPRTRTERWRLRAEAANVRADAVARAMSVPVEPPPEAAD